MSDEIQEMRAELLALRQFTIWFYAGILIGQPGPVTACQQLAKDGVAGYEEALANGAVPDASPELIQQSIRHLESIWNGVEQRLRARGYSA